MRRPAPGKTKSLGTMPCREIEVKNGIRRILHLPGGQRIIAYSGKDGSFRVWDLERGTQVGEEWEDKDAEVVVMALSPGGRTIASGSEDGAVKLWNVDTGKIIKTWKGHTKEVLSVRWSLDGGRVLSGSGDGTFREWDIRSGEIILGPIKAGEFIGTVCYSPNGTMIVTGGDGLQLWDAKTGKLLKTLEGGFSCLAWTSDGKTLITGGWRISKFNTATWSEITLLDGNMANTISLSPNERILASTLSNIASRVDNTAQLWNLKTNQPIGAPLHHESGVISATFSTDGKFLITSCDDGHICTWDLSAIVKEPDLLSNNADATPRPAPKMNGARRMPPGFFDDTIREANLRARLSQSNRPNNHPTPVPRQHTLGHFSSFWRRSKSHRATGRDPQPRSQPLSWTRSLVSGMMRRRDSSDIELREPSVVAVPCTAGKPRNYHARRKPAASSSRPSNAHTTQQHTATQSIPSSSQQPPLAAAASTLPTVAGAGATGPISHPHIIGAGWRARFVGWICCMPIQNTGGQQ